MAKRYGKGFSVAFHSCGVIYSFSWTAMLSLTKQSYSQEGKGEGELISERHQVQTYSFAPLGYWVGL